MKESDSEGLASHTDPELYAGDGDIAGVATTGAHAGRVLSSEMRLSPCADPIRNVGKQHRPRRHGKPRLDTAESKTSSMYGNSNRENREIPAVSTRQTDASAGWNGQKTPQVGLLT